METFLNQVARHLYMKTGGDFARTAVVFPNKRAGLFFNEYLARETSRPLWAPAYLSISELFRHSSDLTVGDSIKLVCDLYKIFKEVTGSKESLDDFYFWGEMLISDFDDADKNMADTDTLFSNLKALNELTDNYAFLEEEQKEAIGQFFRNFSIDQATELKRRFISIWDSLGEIYTCYKALLDSQGIAYEGMLYRRVIDSLDPGNMPYDRYAFVGFNVLNKVEHKLFSKLNEAGKALFYWDYDKFYLKKHPHEAGEFIRRNLRDFPSELPPSCFDNLSKPKDISYIASPTENGQARLLPQWLRENLTETEKETAVVLCNENLLQPVLHSLPENIRHINVTMGFPLSQTPAYSLAKTFVELHTEGYDPQAGRFMFAQATAILRHPYLQKLSDKALPLLHELTRLNRFYPLPSELAADDILKLVFTPCSTNKALCERLSELLKRTAALYRQQGETDADAFGQLYREALFKAFTLTNRFCTLIDEGDLNVQPATLRRLLTRVMSASSIPFHGEPAIGVQVMGVLETRNLDFRHLILLSVNEGKLPQAGGDSSFIPYNLRKAFGMTTVDHKIAVYAYYFYRLLQRAEKVTLVYNTATDGLNRGEMSRFMLQFLIEWNGQTVRRGQLEAEQSPTVAEPITVRKTSEIQRIMRQTFDIRCNREALLSPSALNAYLDCPLKFYYKYVAKLSIPDDVNADIDPAKFGSIFHHAAEHIYKDLTARQKTISKEALENLLSPKNAPRLQNYIDNAFKELFFHAAEDDGKLPEYNGIQLLNSAVILRYIRQLLKIDAGYAPFVFGSSEQKVQEEMEINPPATESVKTRIGGIIDRTDTKDGTLRIVDYKTGGRPDCPESIEALFTPGKKRSGYVFQTFLYASIVSNMLRSHNDGRRVAPALLYIHQAASENYSPVVEIGKYRQKVRVEDFGPYEEEFRSRLQNLLEEIFNPAADFIQTAEKERCEFCDFKKLCKR